MSVFATIDGNLLLWIQKHARFHAWDFFWIAVTSLGNAGIVWLLLSAALLCQRRTRPERPRCCLWGFASYYVTCC